MHLTRKHIGLLNGITCMNPVGVNRTLIQCFPAEKSGNIDPDEPTKFTSNKCTDNSI